MHARSVAIQVSALVCCRWPLGSAGFSEQGKALTKVALEPSGIVLCSPFWGVHGGNEYWRTLLDKLTLTSTQLPDNAIYVSLRRKTPIGQPGWGSMLSVVDGSLAPAFSEDRDPASVKEIQRESSGYAVEVLKDRLRPRDALETTHGGDQYIPLDAVAPNIPCHVLNPDVVSEGGPSELRSTTHSDEADDNVFLVQTCEEEAENAEYATSQKPLFSMRGEERLDEGLDPRFRLREYLDSKRGTVAKRLCYSTPARGSWPLKQGSMGDIFPAEEKFKPLDPRAPTLIRTYLEVFGDLPPATSCDKLVQMDLKLKAEFVGYKIPRRP